MSADLPYHAQLDGVAAADVAYVKRKDAQYGGSWAKRGGVGAFMMLARKWDRLENMISKLGRFGGGDLDASSYDVFAWIAAECRNRKVDRIGRPLDYEGIARDGDVLAEIRDLRRYLLLVEAYMVQQGAVPVPPTAQTTMMKELLGDAAVDEELTAKARDMAAHMVADAQAEAAKPKSGGLRPPLAGYLESLRPGTPDAVSWKAGEGGLRPAVHPSHVLRSSDASSFDVVCVNCGSADIAGGGWGKLAEPCTAERPGTPDDGGQHGTTDVLASMIGASEVAIARAVGVPADHLAAAAQRDYNQRHPPADRGERRDSVAMPSMPALGEPDESETVHDRQPRDATTMEFLACKDRMIDRGSMRKYSWSSLYGQQRADGRWPMHPEYWEEYGK